LKTLVIPKRYNMDVWLLKNVLDVLKGKSVLITGASAGIGEQMAYHYAKMGANVLVTARREKKLQEVNRLCIIFFLSKLSSVLPTEAGCRWLTSKIDIYMIVNRRLLNFFLR
jgi:hypothetical protein